MSYYQSAQRIGRQLKASGNECSLRGHRMDVKRLTELTDELKKIKEDMKSSTETRVRRCLAVRFFEIVDLIEKVERYG